MTEHGLSKSVLFLHTYIQRTALNGGPQRPRPSAGHRSEPMARSVFALRSHVPRSDSQVMTAETKERLHEAKNFT